MTKEMYNIDLLTGKKKKLKPIESEIYMMSIISQIYWLLNAINKSSIMGLKIP